MSEASFKESLLVPLTCIRNKKKHSSQKMKGKSIKSPVSTAESLLADESIPADLRLKYFDNMVRFDRARPPTPVNVITNTEKREEQEQQAENQREEDTRILLNEIPDSKKPLASSILKFMKERRDITWNSRFEAVLDGEVIPDSDIRKIMQFLLGEVIYTLGKLDIPKGAMSIKEKLEISEIPPSWLKHVPRFSKRKQKGRGLKLHRWVVY